MAMVDDTRRPPAALDHPIFRRIALIFGLVFIAHVLAVTVLPQAWRALASDFVDIAANLVAVPAYLWAARVTTPCHRRSGQAWMLFALGQTSLLLATTTWFFLEQVVGTAPFPSIADAFYLAYYPLMLTGLLMLPLRTLTAQEWLRVFLDLNIVMISAALIYWGYLVGPLLHDAEVGEFGAVLLALYPVFDLALITVILFLLFRQSLIGLRVPLLLLMASLVAYAILDTIYQFTALTGSYQSGHLLDPGWSGAVLVGALAAVNQALNPSMPATLMRQGPPVVRVGGIQYLPFVALLAVFAMHQHSHSYPTAVTDILGDNILGVVLILTIVRQISTYLDNDRLNRQLRLELTSRIRAEAALKDAHEHLRKYVMDFQDEVETERANLARELHDQMGHVLTLAKMDLAWVGERLDRSPVAESAALTERMDRCIESIEQCIDTVRGIAANLRPSIIDHLGLVGAIGNDARKVTESSGIALDLELAEGLAIPERQAMGIYRVFQEAMTNVVRHSGAGRAAVRLVSRGAMLILEVEDNGRGIDEGTTADEAGKHFGVRNMQERADLLGGRFEIKRLQAGGTLMRLTVPERNTP